MVISFLVDEQNGLSKVASQLKATQSTYFDSALNHPKLSFPPSLVCYLNIEPEQDIEQFYGPVYSFLLDEQSSVASGSQSTQDWLRHQLAPDVIDALHSLRTSLRKQTQITLQKQQKHRTSSINPTESLPQSTTSGQILNLCYTPVESPEPLPGNHSHLGRFCFRFYLIGKCDIVKNHGSRIGNEFYACFHLEHKTNAAGKSTWKQNTFTLSKRQSALFDFSNEAEWQNCGKCGLDYGACRCCQLCQTNKDRWSDCELSHLDYLCTHLDGLIDSVRST